MSDVQLKRVEVTFPSSDESNLDTHILQFSAMLSWIWNSSLAGKILLILGSTPPIALLTYTALGVGYFIYAHRHEWTVLQNDIILPKEISLNEMGIPKQLPILMNALANLPPSEEIVLAKPPALLLHQLAMAIKAENENQLKEAINGIPEERKASVLTWLIKAYVEKYAHSQLRSPGDTAETLMNAHETFFRETPTYLPGVLTRSDKHSVYEKNYSDAVNQAINNMPASEKNLMEMIFVLNVSGLPIGFRDEVVMSILFPKVVARSKEIESSGTAFLGVVFVEPIQDAKADASKQAALQIVHEIHSLYIPKENRKTPSLRDDIYPPGDPKMIGAAPLGLVVMQEQLDKLDKREIESKNPGGIDHILLRPERKVVYQLSEAIAKDDMDALHRAIAKIPKKDRAEVLAWSIQRYKRNQEASKQSL